MTYCKDCVFGKLGSGAWMECRRHSPVKHNQDGNKSLYTWPYVMYDDWCGEGQAKAEVITRDQKGNLYP